MTAPAPEELGALTSEEAGQRLGPGTVLLLPVGSLEAHGPHLPLETDVIIARETARRAAVVLRQAQIPAFLLPPLPYARARCAASFPGTASLSPDTVAATVLGIARSLAPADGPLLCIVNGHLEPEHVRSLRQAAAEAVGEGLRVVFPDQTRRNVVERLGEEFRQGGGHAGGYETSLVMAAAGRVQESVRAGLPPNPVNLAQALRQGAVDFRTIGGERAYFGDPASASAAEGERLYRVLVAVVTEAVRAAVIPR